MSHCSTYGAKTAIVQHGGKRIPILLVFWYKFAIVGIAKPRRSAFTHPVTAKQGLVRYIPQYGIVACTLIMQELHRCSPFLLCSVCARNHLLPSGKREALLSYSVATGTLLPNQKRLGYG